MKFLQLKDKQLEKLLANLYKKELEELLDFCEEFITSDILSPIPLFVKNKAHRYKTKKHTYEAMFFSLFSRDIFRKKFYQKLTQTQTSQYLYNLLIWEEKEINGEDFNKKLNLNLYYNDQSNYGTWEYNLDGNLNLITHYTYYTFRGLDSDKLFIKNSIRDILKYIFPVPQDYILHSISNPNKTQYQYNNEEGIIKFIPTIEQLVKNNLVQFNKTNDKPLAKTLSILFSSSGIREFYSAKKINLLATDMLTRGFYSYFLSQKNKENKLDILKEFLILQLQHGLPYILSKVFVSHLKKVKFDDYYNPEKSLFDIIKFILNQLPQNDLWVEVNNIIKFCKYRELEFHFESPSKTRTYNLVGDKDDGLFGKTFFASEYYYQIFFEPILKGFLFFLGALGILELKYNDPKSPYDNINLQNEQYISVWDSLEYIRFTKLGLYILGIEKNYTIQTNHNTQFALKFDEYKPIITINKDDSVTLAKLSKFCTQLDTTRYILDYATIFKDCETIEALQLKIDSFYNNIKKDPPMVFKNFFTNILTNANALKRNTQEIVIELKNNKKLLSLFLTNKKLQELTIKASGYRVIILQKDLNKFTKIIKENGFFIDF